MNTQRISEAFSGHRFPETYEHLADNVRWVLPGQGAIDGKEAVIAAVARYESPDGSVSVVSSADIYEFDDDGLVPTITSYAVELDA